MPNNNADNFEDDYVAKSMGATGKWQTIICTIAASSKLLGMWNVYAILFLTPRTDYKCIKFQNNVTIDVQNSTCYEGCLQYEYYQDVFETTVISEFGLICDNEWLSSFTQTIFMLGLMVGIAIFGWVSDRFGRRVALITSCFINVVFMFGSAFAPSYEALTTLRFFVGLGSGGAISISIVSLIEIVGSQYRELAGSIAIIPDGIAECTLAGFAYFAPTWKIYLLEFSVASAVILVLLLFFMPETPRWLVTKGKSDRAVKLMTAAAKVNKRSVNDIRDNVTNKLLELNITENESQKTNYVDLFKTMEFTVITLLSFTIWFITGFCYYGMNQFTALLSSNVFVVVAVIGAFQIPLPFVATIIMKVFGRRKSTIGTYIISGVCMICLIYTPSDTWISITFYVIATSSAFINFNILYIYILEIYPTTIRNMGLSFSSAGSKLGASLAPFVVNLKPQWAATFIFGLLPIIAAAICLRLPETKGRKLRDTVNEGLISRRV